jgi:hypothetical protein
MSMVGENQVASCTGETANRDRATVMTCKGLLILDPATPLNSALAFIETKYSVMDKFTLRYHAGEFFGWTGTHYRSIDAATIRAEIYSFLDSRLPRQAGKSLPIPTDE